ncbi:MAG: Gfo/Idh/MocA family oxidoreductase [Lentisphaerales bacterium]|nr:MAG: Gfo/Idh/MocA family oxidoreductase [Lentisphaerales bacterium]
MSKAKVGVGVIGCGNISDVYFETGKKFEILDMIACADLMPERAQDKAKKHGLRKACTVEELLADPQIDIVLNLTVPKAHAQVALAAVEAKKSVYNEKPLTAQREDGRRLLELAHRNKVLVGGAPDTFLGAGLQTCRKLIDDGAIGKPIAATAFMLGHGPESWHPAPAFYYEVGGGPMFDMGPYYLTALIALMGPIRRVTGSTRITFPERTVTSEPLKGMAVKVETPTHIAGVLDFKCGAIATIVTSFDVWSANVPCIDIYGTEGSLSVPDPNGFGGPVRLRRSTDSEWKEVPLSHGYAENSRCIGTADMAYAIRSGRDHRASGELAYHVLDVMHALHDASREGRHVEPGSTCKQPAPLRADLPPFVLDD